MFTFNAASIPAFVISTTSGNAADDRLGWNVSDCGDINGDGIDDIIVGAPGYNGESGRAYIFFGGGAFVGDLDADSADVILDGSWPGARFGWDVSGAGDFNGDGLNDTIVGAPGNNSDTGAAYIFYGSNSLGGTIGSVNANLSIDGENTGDFFGCSVSDLGDVCKEPLVDHVVISELYANAVDETSPAIGEYLELYNPTSSPVLLNNWVIEDTDSHSFTLIGTIPAYGFFLIAIDNYQSSSDPMEASWPVPDFDCGFTAGSVFANSGDEIRLKDDTGAIIDTFGYGSSAELYEGTYYPTLPNPWESYERKLGETLPNGGNAIDTDNNENDFAVRLAAEPQNTASPAEVPPGWSIYNDVIIGAYGWGNDRGAAYVFFGSSGIPSIATDADVILTGEADYNRFGFSVSGAGDVNSDDYGDILVGAPGFGSNRGRGYIYHGAKEMQGWSQDIKFTHWDESDGAVNNNSWPIHKTQSLAQAFIPDDDYLITKISVNIAMDNATVKDPGDLLFKLKNDTGGLPPQDFISLATTNTVSSIPLLANTFSWVEFEFTTPYRVKSGEIYWIVGVGTGKNGNECWVWKEDEDLLLDYPGDAAWALGEDKTWTLDPAGQDYWFKVYGRLPEEISANVTLTGETAGDLFGWSVADAGDVNSDGYSDVIVGAPGTSNGSAYIILGSNKMQNVNVSGAGWDESRLFENYESGGNMELIVYSGQSLSQSFISSESFNMTGISIYAETFGAAPGTLTITLQGSMGSAPDTIPDGVTLAQAAPVNTGNISYEWINFTWSTPYLCAEGNEYFIVAEGTGADQSNCWVWYLNGWGGYQNGSYAYNQTAGWIARDRDCYFRAYGKLETGLPNITIEGEFPGDLFGYSVSGIRNFNGDGYDDIVIGAPGNGNGKVYIFNSSNLILPVIGAISANYTAGGENPADRFGWSVSGAGNVNQTIGYEEVIAGAPFQDPGGLGDAGRAYILSMPGGSPAPPVGNLPFRINNDGEFAAMAASEGWGGDGSSGNPYIIENYNIDGDGYGYCIYIGNTTASFIIRNCIFSNSSGNPGNYFWNSGVGLYSAPNGVVTQNTFDNCTGNALHIMGTTNLTIVQNSFLNGSGSGIYLESSSDNVIEDNIFDNNNYGLEMNTNSNSNTISNNRFTNNSEAMDLWSCDNNIISDNYGSDNGIFAYLFSSCNGNGFLNNTIADSGTGIYLQSNCNDNTIINNTISNMTGEGILIESSSSNILELNDIQGCRYGLYTLLGGLNFISNNTFSNNTDYGIYLDPGSNQNTISNNTISSNGEYGILLISADLNIIIFNDIFNNSLYGINTTSFTNDNEIHHNTFVDNNDGNVQAYDDGTGNTWDDGKGEGNLWGDYEDRYVPPATSNGKIWDLPYDINGSAGAQDLFPLALYPWNMDLRIDNNTDFADTAAFYGWAGDGSESNPFIIEGLTIDAGGLGYGIYVGNTTSYFIIRNCSIENSSGNSNQYFRNSGIYLFNATNGTIQKNDIKACDGNGINIEYSSDIMVAGNTVRNNNWSGIYTGYYSNVTISDNTCSFNNWSGVYIWSTSYSFVLNNTCLNNSDGITLEYADNNIISDNDLIDNSWEGIYCDNSHLNTIVDNTCLGNYDGLYLYYSDNNSVSENQFSNNTGGGFGGTGIFLDHGNNNDILNNTCCGNKEDGIYIFYSDFNIVDNNTCQDNPDEGISVYKSINCSISNNTLTGNGFGLVLENRCFDIMIENNNISYNSYDGIYFLILCINNTIRNNTIMGNGDDGIYMNDRNSANLVENNTISGNAGNAINLTYDSDNFIIIYNIIENNTEYGIQILDNDCENNLIHHNGFFFNNGSGVQAYDNGSNAWDNGYPSGGNFWSDYTGVDLNSTPAQDVPPPDGFGDTPYDTEGQIGAQDRYPLLTFPWTPPLPDNLPEISDVSALPNPQEAGDFINITCNVTDDEGVAGVWINITLPGGGYLNSTMTHGSVNQWYLDSIFTLIGMHEYEIWAGDTSGNWNCSSGFSFTIQDTTAPEITDIGITPVLQESGKSINIFCNVTDNVDVAGVWVNISLPDGTYINISLQNGLGNTWYDNLIFSLPGIYQFTIWTNDSFGTWNFSTNNSFTVSDTTPPEISNIVDTPDPQVVGGGVNISCDVTDIVGVFGVWINITMPGGGYVNISLEKGADDGWFNDTIYNNIGIYNYVIWVNDTTGNWNCSGAYSFWIYDDQNPVISNVQDSPDPQETGGLVNISCDIIDSVGVLEVWINITSPLGGNTNTTLTKGPGNQWFYEAAFLTLGIHDYVIWASDLSGNWASSIGHTFLIRDTTPPAISSVWASPNPQNIWGNVNVSCDVWDFVEVMEVFLNITKPDGSTLNISMGKGPGDSWFNDSVYSQLGIYNFVIWARDTSGNLNSSSGHSFTIKTGPPYDIILVSGDGQSGVVGTTLTEPLVVEVRDGFGNPVPDADVWFNVSFGGGTIDGSNPLKTSSSGRAQVNLTLGTLTGARTVMVEIAGNGVSQAVFTEFGVPDKPYNIIIISGDGQTGHVNSPLAKPFVVEVNDRFGNIIPNVDVWFNVTLGGGSLDIVSPISTGIDGRATANLTMGTQAQPNSVTAEISSSGIDWVLFSATGLAQNPHDIIIISGNSQSNSAGEILLLPLVVEVTDQFGNRVSNTSVWFNITQGGGSLDSSSPVYTNLNGRAQINMTLGPKPGINSILAQIIGDGTNQVIFIATATSNQPEIISLIEGIELMEDDPPYKLQLFASAIDDRDLPADLKWFINDCDTALYTISGQGTNVIIITPRPNMYGNDLVTLMVVDSDGLSEWQSLWINITPVNDKPNFYPEPPDLTITADLGYTFNYAPYIMDIDNLFGELIISTDDTQHTQVAGHLVTYIYPEDMVNTQVFITLTVSDGFDYSQTVIKINVTEDNVPVLRQNLPDVTLFEGEIKYDVFDLDDYFFDPDGDAVYFSYGYSHIKITIHDNHMVDFHAEGDWYGKEYVTFRARNPSSAIVEDTILVSVNPVNDPPVISNVPDLVVHFDFPYTFDLSPYIYDADNSSNELLLSFMEAFDTSWVVSSNINTTFEDNLRMIVNYPQIYLGMTFKVKIIVFDGLDFDWQIINITVSNNWQPKLAKEIPDIVFFEDEYISDKFNVNTYFADEDGETLFFTYGHERVIVIIHPNGSVDFSAPDNWWGIENVTIRATDASGALVEDVIMVTVLPVNDPPEIKMIPNQEGYVGVTWILDIVQYLSDQDNNVTELDISCDSQHVTVVGTVLVFQYPEEIRENAVKITVRDPGNAYAETTFNVTIGKAIVPILKDSDSYQYIWYLIPLIVALIVAILLYTYLKGRYEIEEALLVYRKKGILISLVNRGRDDKMDRDLVTGMFTAIQDFVNDVFESEGKSPTQLKVMELGDKKVLIEHGTHTYIAAVFKGGTRRLVPKIRSTLTELETNYIDVLEEWNGDMDSMEGVDAYLEGLIKS